MEEKDMKCKLCQGRGTLPSFDGPWSDMCDCRKPENTDDEKKYYVVCYMRIKPDFTELMTRDQAKVEVEQARLMQPENVYRIESIDEDEYVVQRS